MKSAKLEARVPSAIEKLRHRMRLSLHPQTIFKNQKVNTLSLISFVGKIGNIKVLSIERKRVV